MSTITIQPNQPLAKLYGQWQPLYNTIKGFLFIERLPRIKDEEMTDPSEPRLVILDDLMAETNSAVTQMFTKKSHHANISVISIVQNIFSKNKEHRTISLNSHYLVLFKKSSRSLPDHTSGTPDAKQDFARGVRRCYSNTVWIPSLRFTPRNSRGFEIAYSYFSG